MLTARYQGLYHTNLKNVLLIRVQELDNEDDRTIFPSFPAYWVNKKRLSSFSKPEKNNNLRVFLIQSIVSIKQWRRLLRLQGTSLLYQSFTRTEHQRLELCVPHTKEHHPSPSP